MIISSSGYLLNLNRHEKPDDSSLSNQNLQDRYHGKDDPVAGKIMNTYATSQGLAPPEDQSITSIFLSSLPADATELSIRTRITQSLPGIQPTDIKSVVHVTKTKYVLGLLILLRDTNSHLRCAFVNFKQRSKAELAAQAWSNGLDMDGQRIAVKWGRGRVGGAKPKPVTTEEVEA